MQILLVCLWVLLYSLIPILNNNIKRNIISAIHSILTVILCTYQDPYYIYYISTSYYTYDMVLQLLGTQKMLNVSTISLGIHHIIAVYSLQFIINGPKEFTDPFLYMFMLLELSNFPVYIMYHWKQTNGKKNDDNDNGYILIITKILLTIEIIIYFTLRLTYSLYILIVNSNSMPTEILITSAMLYLLSIFWWVSMLNQIRK